MGHCWQRRGSHAAGRGSAANLKRQSSACWTARGPLLLCGRQLSAHDLRLGDAVAAGARRPAADSPWAGQLC